MAVTISPDCPECGRKPPHLTMSVDPARVERREYRCQGGHVWVVDDIADGLAGEAGDWV